MSSPPDGRTGADVAPGVPALPRERVSSRAVTYWTVRALPPWVVLAVVETAVFVPVGPPLAVWLPVVAVTLLGALALVVVMPRWRYRIHRWEASPVAFQTQSGWLVVERRIAPLSRVQTVDVERGVLENLFGLATLTVTTASAAGALQVPALDRAVAERLSADLARVAGDSPDDAT